jgi:hypothetical protein
MKDTCHCFYDTGLLHSVIQTVQKAGVSSHCFNCNGRGAYLALEVTSPESLAIAKIASPLGNGESGRCYLKTKGVSMARGSRSKVLAEAELLI